MAGMTAATPRIDVIRDVVTTRQGKVMEMDGEFVYLDGFTASMLTQVHDALSEPYRTKFMRLPWRRMVAVGWAIANKART
jgi:hypothetical protein